MKIITRKIEITEPLQVESESVKIADFQVLQGVTATAYQHGNGSEHPVLAKATVMCNSVADHPVTIDVENNIMPNRRMKKPLFFNRPLVRNSYINIQLRDISVALLYPYTIVLTLYAK